MPYELRPPHHQTSFDENEECIRQGEMPERYKEISGLVAGDAILEVGSADGTLALVMAMTHQKVIACEVMAYRHNAALKLQQLWHDKGHDVDKCVFVNADIQDAMKYLHEVDTLVVIRTIYHLPFKTQDPVLGSGGTTHAEHQACCAHWQCNQGAIYATALV